MVKQKGNIYYADETCPSCGFRVPNMPFCRLTGTCVRCARERLRGSDVCEKCASRAECDEAIRGLEFIKMIEQGAIAVIPDLASVLFEYTCRQLERYAVAKAEEVAEVLVRTFLAVTSTLLIVRDVPTWLRAVLKPTAIRAITMTPIDVIELAEPVKQALQEYGMTLGVDGVFLANFYKFLRVRFLTQYRTRGVAAFLQDTFTDTVLKALESSWRQSKQQ